MIFAKKLWKKIILGTSDAWSMRRSSHQPSDPAYHIEDCRISGWLEEFYFKVQKMYFKYRFFFNA